jgi:glutamine amidotransferase
VVELLRAVTALDANACLNMMATDGTTVVATAWGETLCYRVEADGIMVASEPHDDESNWIKVDDRQVVIADSVGVKVRTLEPSADELDPLDDVPA